VVQRLTVAPRPCPTGEPRLLVPHPAIFARLMIWARVGAQAGERQLAVVLREARFARLRRVTETPFNIILEARP
jgi:hypothetical protein